VYRYRLYLLREVFINNNIDCAFGGKQVFLSELRVPTCIIGNRGPYTYAETIIIVEVAFFFSPNTFQQIIERDWRVCAVFAPHTRTTILQLSVILGNNIKRIYFFRKQLKDTTGKFFSVRPMICLRKFVETYFIGLSAVYNKR